MFMPGASHTPMPFSFTSSAAAAPIRSAVPSFQVQAISVAQGNAVVVTPHSFRMRSPAGPSAVMTFGIP